MDFALQACTLAFNGVMVPKGNGGVGGFYKPAGAGALTYSLFSCCHRPFSSSLPRPYVKSNSLRRRSYGLAAVEPNNERRGRKEAV